MTRIFAFCLLAMLCRPALGKSGPVVVVSDIDDTLKKSNSMGNFEQVYHFYQHKPFSLLTGYLEEVRDHFRGQKREVVFYYVSASFRFLFDMPSWIKEQGLPEGEAHQRKFWQWNVYRYKYDLIKGLLLRHDLKKGQVLFFGDNSSADARVYRDLLRNLSLNGRAYIRDVQTSWTFPFSEREKARPEDPRVTIFFSEAELLRRGPLSRVSSAWKEKLLQSVKARALIPRYTLQTLYRRLKVKNLCGASGSFVGLRACRKRSRHEGRGLLEKYYERWESPRVP